MLAGNLLAWPLLVRGAKVIPGGPFVSVTGDILPVLFSAVVIFIGGSAYASARLGQRLAILLLAGLAVIRIGLALSGIASFTAEPYARGKLIEW